MILHRTVSVHNTTKCVTNFIFSLKQQRQGYGINLSRLIINNISKF